jgi:EAL domain-containing protein (putative c-di-GMP-specific phosphodiesterase class I)
MRRRYGVTQRPARLSYLRRLPVDKLTVDRWFVLDVHQSARLQNNQYVIILVSIHPRPPIVCTTVRNIGAQFHGRNCGIQRERLQW